MDLQREPPYWLPGRGRRPSTVCCPLRLPGRRRKPVVTQEERAGIYYADWRVAGTVYFNIISRWVARSLIIQNRNYNQISQRNANSCRF